jgi:hypothetical protein
MYWTPIAIIKRGIPQHLVEYTMFSPRTSQI